MTELELWEWIMEGHYPKGWPENPSEDRRATAILTRDIIVKKWQGHWDPEKVETWPAGKKVKVIMASRFGDVGITDDLDAVLGYHYRTQCVDKPTGLLSNIEKILLSHVEVPATAKAESLDRETPDN